MVNIPNVIWIDEDGVIVRPPEPGWPSPRADMPKEMMTALPKFGRAPNAPKPPEDGAGQWGVLLSGQDRATYADAIRDWARQRRRPASSRSAPDEVVARSQPRSAGMSEGAAHFELANHLWRGRRARRARSPTSSNATDCSPTTGRTSARRGRSSATSVSAATTAAGRRRPVEGEEADWPFESDFRSDVEIVEVGGYYPKTL